jgi:Tfp pilus assembly protein PilZ
MSPHSKQPACPRYEFSARSEHTAHVDSQSYQPQKLLNLSLASLSFQCDTPSQLGTEVEVSLDLPELDTTLPLRGQVVWANRAFPSDMGLRLLDVTQQQRDVLERYLQRVFSRQSEQWSGEAQQP